MPTSDRVVPDAAAATDNPRYPALWTMALATALLGIVALPRRSAQPADRAADRDGDHSRGASNGDGARKESPSHEGADAHRVAQTEQDRGRSADKPTEVPVEGWKDVLKRTYRDIGENRLTLVSAGVTFFVLHARQNAAGFYEKSGYRAVGDLFTEVGRPHLRMERRGCQ